MASPRPPLHCALLLLFGIGVLLPQSAFGDSSPPKKDRALVMDFSGSAGIEQNLPKTLENLFGSVLVDLKRFEVIQKQDLGTLLEVGQQKQLLGCDDESCLADVGVALGARWIISGSLALLGGRRVLTLKLVDAQSVRLQKQLTRRLPLDEGEYAEAIRQLTYELYDLDVPALAVPWYENPVVLGIIGTVIVAGATALYTGSQEPETLTTVQTREPPDSHLGTVLFGINSRTLGVTW